MAPALQVFIKKTKQITKRIAVDGVPNLFVEITYTDNYKSTHNSNYPVGTHLVLLYIIEVQNVYPDYSLSKFTFNYQALLVKLVKGVGPCELGPGVDSRLS